MTANDRQYNNPTGLTQVLKQKISHRIPFSISAFEDRDDLGWLSLITERSGRRLYKFQDGNLMWATVTDGRVVKIEFVEGRAAKELWHKVGTQLPEERTREIIAALCPGRDAGEGLRAAFGPKLQSLNDVAELKKTVITRTGGGQHKVEHTIYVFQVHHFSPRRRAVLQLEVDSDGLIVSAKLLSGEKAAQLLAATKEW